MKILLRSPTGVRSFFYPAAAIRFYSAGNDYSLQLRVDQVLESFEIDIIRTDRQTERQTDKHRQTERQTNRQTDRHRYTEASSLRIVTSVSTPGILSLILGQKGICMYMPKLVD
uniref:Glyco_hydro_38C domain-containing protein n=1 Tax=Haemonchus contortus TaxID=6289 RepID=A0A7I4Y3D5_HAECO